MKKITGFLLIIFIMVFSCAFDLIYDPAMEETLAALSQQETPMGEPAAEGESDTGLMMNGELVQPLNSEPDPIIQEELTEEPVIAELPTEEPQQPAWEEIDEDQVNKLLSLYYEMTPTGKLYAGWFPEGDYAPCSWNGISCEGGRVTGLTFKNAGYFVTFPDAILELRDLKELHMTDTLMRGPLPETLFKDLPKLEVLELSGNFLTGEIPALPEAFEFYPMLRVVRISDNREDERKTNLQYQTEYADVAGYSLDPYDYPELDLTPGLDGTIPENWNLLPLLSEIDLSGNMLVGAIPESFISLPLTKLDLRDNAESLRISQGLYDQFLSSQNPEIILDGILTPQSIETEPIEEPAEENLPTEEPTEEPMQFFMAPPVQPTQEIPTEVPPVVPTEEPEWIIPTEVPTAVPPTPRTIFVVVTATPEPYFYTSTPAPRYYTATPQPYYYYPTATPYYYQPPVYYYPTATPYSYQPVYIYPTATSYTNYNPGWVYPTATTAYSYPQSPTQAPVNPTQDPASLFGFTYQLEAMTDNNIPMIWRYTGMTEYSINYLDASGNLYPAFAMEWKPAADLCNASACRATVSVPEELLQQGSFSLELRARDASGKTYVSDPVTMEVSIQSPTPAPTPQPEQPKSFLAGFFEWLFGPILRLFKK